MINATEIMIVSRKAEWQHNILPGSYLDAFRTPCNDQAVEEYQGLTDAELQAEI